MTQSTVTPRGKDWLFSEDTDLKRDLGLIEAVSIVISRIIGSGIFRTPAPIMALVASTALFGTVWVIGAIITLFGAVCYAELVAMMPKSGGPYVFLREAYGPLWTFLRGWAMFFVSETGAIAAVSLVFAEYSIELYMIVSGNHLNVFVTRATVIILSLFVIWVHTAINMRGVHLSGIVQVIVSSAKVIALGLVIAVCFTGGGGSWSNFTTPLWPEEFNWGTILAVGAALRYAFFAYSGWEGATYVAEEVKNPRKNLPLSLIIGILGVLLLYAGANAAYMYQLPMAEFMNADQIAVDAVKMAIGGVGGILISLAVMLNTFGNVSTQILVKARTWQAMARDGLFFKSCARLHPRFKTPNKALMLQGLWATVLLIFASFAANSYEAVIDFFTLTGTIFNLMTFASIFILRKKYPAAPRPFKAWFYPWSVIIIILLYSMFFIITLITALLPSLLGICLTATGLLYYYRKNISALLKGFIRSKD